MICTFAKKLFENPSNGYCVALFQTDDSSVPEEARKKDKWPSSKITFTGFGYKIPATDAIQLDIIGKWKKSQKYGIQFAIEQCAEIVPPTVEGIVGYLSSGLIRGVSEITARKITDKFGLRALEIIEKEPKRLSEIRGLSDKKIERIVESFSRNKELRNIVSFLSPYDISLNKASKIYDKFGVKSMEILNETPYDLCAVKGFGFLTVDKIALKVKCKPNDKMRIRACADYLMTEFEAKGHVYVPQQELRDACFGQLNQGFKITAVTADEIRNALIEEIRAGRLVNNNGLIYHPMMFQREVELAKSLSDRSLLSPPEWGDVEGALDRAQAKREITLSDAQCEAVRMCFHNNLSLITGGPGTGKTTVLKVIIDVYRDLTGSDDILLAAPTGKAAKRMAEGTGMLTAKTLHSALGLTKEEDKEAHCSIKSGLVIVDEMSMVDIRLAHRLFRNMDSKTTVVLVGDVDQLPSIGPGNVFRDMLQSECIPVVRLDTVFRQSGVSRIVLNAEKIRNGTTGLFYGNDFNFIDTASEEETLEMIKRCYFDEVKKSGLEHVQILAPRREMGETSVLHINNTIRDIINPYVGEKNELYYDGRRFRIHDKIIQNKNMDGISNGDIGVIESVFTNDDEKFAAIRFSDGTEKCYAEDALGVISLAYALTIHKSQGSEYSTVIIPVLMRYYHMLKRNLIYTAITRAKKKVILIGEKRALMAGIHQNDSSKRNSLLAERVKQYVGDKK
ncbi:SF1B family DNA helicase RecD2 [Ructibacterium gallinarum]|uniref:ATP-dependent RecD2 DNA helicase n=1 Tax=Ructibacterium gallinarum TaxID=2779355 RepID=A0A9D5R8Z6_9FIRM|nr:ATP-dependent RecD-like DNA helicase [Ructibacterium gallinarum]MBE5040525.1 ATP-dependent RecD-like DNA helicase [Ructibacterium gallinarum]